MDIMEENGVYCWSACQTAPCDAMEFRKKSGCTTIHVPRLVNKNFTTQKRMVC